MYIDESEAIDVKPILGEQIYIDLCEAQTGTTLTDNQLLILDGGVYTVDNRKYHFSGLKKAIAYFVYSRLIRNADGQLTSYGFVNKELNESSPAYPAKAAGPPKYTPSPAHPSPTGRSTSHL